MRMSAKTHKPASNTSDEGSLEIHVNRVSTEIHYIINVQ